MEYRLKNVKKKDLLAIQILGENNLIESNVYKVDYLKYLLFKKDIILLKLEINNKIIGVVIYKLFFNEDRLHIMYLLVDKKYRSKGYGSKILDKIKNNDLNTISLHVNINNENAIKNYLKAIELDKNLKPAFTGLLNVLSQTTNIEQNNSKIIYAHNELNKINLNYKPEKYIEDLEIKKILEQTNIIVEKNLENIEFDKVQTYREQKLRPHCNRHLKIFKTKNIIPKYCFGCYKIQIEVENVLELIKLYIVFDKIKLKRDNSRKCMIELRPLVNGNYKGLIFCNSINEAEEILKEINSVLIKILIKI